MLSRKRINLLMISSSSTLGGGTKHMFDLGKKLNYEFKVFYAIPKNNNFQNFLSSSNHIFICEREINFVDIINLREFIYANSIDIIHSHGKGAGVLGRILRIFVKKPLVYTFHGIHLKCHSCLIRLIYKIYEFSLGWIDSVKVLVSKSEKNYAIKNNVYIGNKSVIINNGVLNKQIKEYKLFTKQLENLNRTNVISICRFVSQKNIEEILQIAQKLTNINFSIIGDGPLWKEINALLKSKKLNNVYLLGEKKNIFKYLYSADIYLSTSLYEGLPISILEAMSIGIPILASNVTGNCDTIEHGKSGFLYELHDIEMAKKYLLKLADNESLRIGIGYNAFNRQRKRFSMDLMINKYRNLYRDLIDIT